MSKKKLILNNEFPGFIQAVGIATGESEFQVSLLINAILKIKLALAKSIQKVNTQNEISFPCFSYLTDKEELIHLLKNKNKGAYLFKNQAQFDFLVIISGSNPEAMISELKLKLKSENAISFVAEVLPEKLSNLKSYLQ